MCCWSPLTSCKLFMKAVKAEKKHCAYAFILKTSFKISNLSEKQQGVCTKTYEIYDKLAPVNGFSNTKSWCSYSPQLIPSLYELNDFLQPYYWSVAELARHYIKKKHCKPYKTFKMHWNSFLSEELKQKVIKYAHLQVYLPSHRFH